MPPTVPPSAPSSLAALRAEALALPGHDAVEPDRFRELALSRRALVRADVARARLRGLRDPATGRTFLVEEERLLDAASLPVPSDDARLRDVVLVPPGPSAAGDQAVASSSRGNLAR